VTSEPWEREIEGLRAELAEAREDRQALLAQVRIAGESLADILTDRRFVHANPATVEAVDAWHVRTDELVRRIGGEEVRS
jgi:hypothetical protein